MTDERDERFGRARRLRRAADFARVYRGRVHAADGVLVVNSAVNPGAPSRLGVSISRAVGNAVTRNRWKRLIREAFRRSRRRIPDGLDLVVRPRRGASPEYHAIVESLVDLATQVARRWSRG